MSNPTETNSPLSSSGGVVSPLAGRRSPTDELLEFRIVLFVQPGSFNRLIQMSKVWGTGAGSTVISGLLFHLYQCSGGCVFWSLHSNGLELSKGAFV
ncbi:MAG: hypothetical protein LBL79_08145 [Prevotella sp.]|nr:hypothetical protein [Prevotella sp.]